MSELKPCPLCGAGAVNETRQEMWAEAEFVGCDNPKCPLSVHTLGLSPDIWQALPRKSDASGELAKAREENEALRERLEFYQRDDSKVREIERLKRALGREQQGHRANRVRRDRYMKERDSLRAEMEEAREEIRRTIAHRDLLLKSANHEILELRTENDRLKARVKELERVEELEEMQPGKCCPHGTKIELPCDHCHGTLSQPPADEPDGAHLCDTCALADDRGCPVIGEDPVVSECGDYEPEMAEQPPTKEQASEQGDALDRARKAHARCYDYRNEAGPLHANWVRRTLECILDHLESERARVDDLSRAAQVTRDSTVDSAQVIAERISNIEERVTVAEDGVEILDARTRTNLVLQSGDEARVYCGALIPPEEGPEDE